MNRSDFNEVVQGAIAASAQLLISKGAEYSGDQDALANFKRNAEKQGTTPLQIWKQYYGKHADSIDSYFKRVQTRTVTLALDEAAKHFRTEHETMDGEMFVRIMNTCTAQAMADVEITLSEPIEGRFHDIINYCILGIALLKEQREAL